MTCNNIQRCHNPITLSEDENALRWFCTECKESGIIRKEPIKNVPEKREYARVYRKDILQGKDNLFYKYYSQHLLM